MIQSLPNTAIPLCAAAIALAATACKPVDDRMEITTTRKVGKLAPVTELGLPMKQRMGIEAPTASEPTAPPFAWEAPEGWKEATGSAMRIANFTFGPADEGECYFSVIPGGGGLLLNVNRWRTQMGLQAADEAAAAALPDKQFLFGVGKLIDLKGEFTAMGATEAKPGYRMLGVILPEMDLAGSRVAFFLKMTGPETLVEAEQSNFDLFCNSLKFGTQ